MRAFGIIDSSPTIFLYYLSLGVLSTDAKVKTVHDALAYLQRFGYANSAATELVDLQAAIKLFQGRNGLNVSGELNNETLTQMNVPRCGVPDMFDPDTPAARRKRYVHQGGMWSTKNLTYFLINYTSDMPSENVTTIIERALQFWSDASTLTFAVSLDSLAADIHVLFASGAHGDLYPFDGPGGTLAHAFFPFSPTPGATHFDEAETWTDAEYIGTNLLKVATHEFGHTLGLGHSTDSQSVMQAYYTGYDPNFHLGADDIAAITTLYDSATTVPTTIRVPAVDECCSAQETTKLTNLLYALLLIRTCYVIFYT